MQLKQVLTAVLITGLTAMNATADPDPALGASATAAAAKFFGTPTEYPFVAPPPRTMRQTLWEDFDDLPLWAQRGRIFYMHDATDLNRLKQIKAIGGLAHTGPIRDLKPENLQYIRDNDIPLVLRLDGQYFWGRDYTQQMEAIRGGGWAAYHSTVPNTRWYEKFPLSLAATKVLRDGQPMIEYYGSAWVQRRDISYVHPVAMQMRAGFLRECVLGEMIFGIPLDLKCGGYASGVWWDNPGNVIVSYDAYATALVAREFAKAFGERYPDAEEHKPFYGDPPYFWIKYHDQDVRRWYEKFWADAYAGYYAWQYQFCQQVLAPKLHRQHFFVGGNSKLNWSTANWDYYLFSWPNTYDVLGPCETSPVYTNKEALGLKLALAASNGKPAGLWSPPTHPGMIGEALTCLAVASNASEEQARFHKVNVDLYHQARPGGRVAVLYHLLDGIYHSEIANLTRVCDQIWRSGAALEVITELHLTPAVLKQFDVLVIPGFQFSAEEVEAIQSYVESGGNVLLLGDNRDQAGQPLGSVIGGLAPDESGDVKLGKGTLRCVPAQLLTQAQMAEAMQALGAYRSYRIIQPQGVDLMLNVLTQPQRQLTGIHLVNYTDTPVRNITVKIPSELKGGFVTLIGPRGPHQATEIRDGTITIPLLVGYEVAVVCPDAATRDAILARNREAIPELPVPDKLPGRMRHSVIAAEEIEPETLQGDEMLCHLRASGRTGFHRVDADIVTSGKGRVGVSQDLRLKIHALGVWSPDKVQFDQVKFVFVDEQSGYREEVPVPVGEVKGTAEAEDMRQSKDLTLPAGTLVRKDTHVTWTPERPGRYQVYLGYRYNHEVYDGKSDSDANQQGEQYRRRDYMFGRPLLKLSYEDRLPGMIIDVSE